MAKITATIVICTLFNAFIISCDEDSTLEYIPADCRGGPLADPLVDCEPTPVPDTGDFYEDCVARINQIRWECQCLPPLERWYDGEECADEHAEYDAQYGPHQGFMGHICSPCGNAQNECANWGSKSRVIKNCLLDMWNESQAEPGEETGHYLIMSSDQYTSVACGVHKTSEGGIWSVQNYK